MVRFLHSGQTDPWVPVTVWPLVVDGELKMKVLLHALAAAFLTTGVLAVPTAAHGRRSSPTASTW